MIIDLTSITMCLFLKIKKLVQLLLLVILSLNLNAQQFGFLNDQIIEIIENGDTLKNPWAGGLNFCQFSSIDLNHDGQDDLMVFDRSGNRIIPFINNGLLNTID